MMMKSLSIRQPWAWMILHANKDIENRSWPTRFRGTFLIHASKSCSLAEWNDAHWFALEVVGEEWFPPMPKDIDRGGFVGYADIVDCVSNSGSPWHMPNQYGFVLKNVTPIPFIPYRGRLGLFDVPAIIQGQQVIIQKGNVT